jgi:hypothetical protein
MKKLFPTVAIAAAALTFMPLLPAGAQSFYTNSYDNFHSGYGGNFHFGYRGNLNAQQAQIRARIENARARGFLTVNEYNNLMRAFNQIAVRESALRANGFNWRERQQLANRLQNLSDRVNRQIYDRQTAGRWGNRWW